MIIPSKYFERSIEDTIEIAEAHYAGMRPAACVTPLMGTRGAGAGVDSSAWEQKKREARKMLAVGAVESPNVQRTLLKLSYSNL